MPGTGVYPNGQFLGFDAASPAFDPSYPFRGVLHTTESVDYTPSSTSYYGNDYAPHFTVARKGSSTKVYQHFSTNNGSRALANATGGVETNRAGAIQIEIAWRAANIANMPPDMVTTLHDLIAWISNAKGIARTAPPFFGANDGYGTGAPSRMSFQTWRGYNAWCGHQHVPENKHWDPGLINMAPLLQP